MPEGDTVYRTARSLDEALAGHTLVRSDFRVPKFATVDLAGESVHSAASRGKHLLIIWYVCPVFFDSQAT